MNKFAALLLTALLIPAGFVTAADTNGAPRRELKPGEADASIAFVAARMLEQSHYLRQPFNDEVSSKMLDRYLQLLDPQRMHFLQSDLAKFEPYRNRLDDLILRRGDTWPAYEIFNVFLERLAQRVEYCDELLKNIPFDFSGNERVLINRKDEPAPKTLIEARQLWRERLRFEYLQEKLARSGDKKTNAPAKLTGTNAPALKPKTVDEEIAQLLSKRNHRNLRIFREMDSDDVFELYLSSLARTYDPHTDYLGKSQFEQFSINMNLALFGIGAQLRMDDDGYCNIERIMPGGPASKNKQVREKWRIVAVAQSNQPPVDVVGMNLNKTVQLVRGPKGTEVRLTLEDPETHERREVSLIRDEIPLEEQQAKARLVELPGPDGARLRIGVIDLPSFYASMESARGKSEPRFTSKDVALLIEKMKQEDVRGIILDLRRNGGGSLEEAVKLTGLFIKTGPVVQVRGPEGDPIIEADDDAAVLWDGPLAVLTSRFSASASEIVAAALQDYGRAIVVGDSTTHGKGTVQSLSRLAPYLSFGGRFTNDPGALKFTIRKFYRATGAATQFKGVEPDIVLPSVLNHSKDIGEAAHDNALPWNTISAVPFEPVNRVAPYLAELRQKSAARVAASREFDYIREDIAEFLKRQEDKTISLNEAERLREKQQEDARKKARDKERLARPQPDFKEYELTLKNALEPGLPPPLARTNSVSTALADPGHPTLNAAANDPLAVGGEDSTETAPPVDAALDETKAILVDYLGLLGKTKVVTAEAKPRN
jgi:carboxyl-terminal processing protease